MIVQCWNCLKEFNILMVVTANDFSFVKLGYTCPYCREETTRVVSDNGFNRKYGSVPK